MVSQIVDRFSGRWGFLLAAMGGAIGTGNIWRFPKEAAQNGGGAFMIVWLIALFVWSIPILIAELALGKHSRVGTIGTYKKLLGRHYAFMGAFMLWITVAILSYYVIIMGWTFRYSYVALSGGLSNEIDSVTLWNDFISSPLELLGWQVIGLFITAFIILRGVRRGLELANKILLPTLVVLLVVAAIWALSLPGAGDGLKFLYVPRAEYLFRAETWIRGFSHSAWSISAGGGAGITFAIYLRNKEDTNLNSVVKALGNNAVELIAGIAVIGTLFALTTSNFQAEQAIAAGGVGLTFIHLASLFSGMPGGGLLGLIFFLSMAFAALTSTIGGVELIVRNLMDHGWDRPKAVGFSLSALFLMGLPSVMSIHFLVNQDFVYKILTLIVYFLPD